MLFSDQSLGLPLPATSPIHQDESGNGYALRLAGMNGILFSELVSLVASPGHRYIPAKAAPTIAYLFGSGSADVRQAIPELRTSKGKTLVAFMGHILNRKYLVRHTSPQVCPDCLYESGYAKAVWDLAMSVACEAHHIALVDQCNVCHRRLSWRRPTLTTCWCGHALSELPRVAAAREACVWNRRLTQLLLVNAPAESIADLAFLDGLDLDMLQRLVRVCGLSVIYNGLAVRPGVLVRQRSCQEMRSVVWLGLQRCAQLPIGTASIHLIGDDLFESAGDAVTAMLVRRFGLKDQVAGRMKASSAQLEFKFDQVGS